LVQQAAPEVRDNDAVTDVVQAMPDLVPLREFIVSPGFAGAAAVAAAVIVLCAVLFATRRAGKRFNQELEQRECHHQEARQDEQHAGAVQRCWERLTWVVQTAGIEPAVSVGATLGLGPELALELLRGLLRDAEQLADATLASAVTVYQNQFVLVLAQQGGSLSGVAAGVAVSGDGKPAKQPQPPAGAKADAESSPAAVEKLTATAEAAVGGRRRRL
jgi:hypothetical protein